jgi:virginiamycin A acetyltransferase
MALITETQRQRLIEKGISVLRGNTFDLPDPCLLEPPCSMKWMIAQHALQLGAFSYAVSGYYFFASIGRYTSIGESVQIGRGSHPISWGSTSPLFYHHHREVLDFDYPAAAHFRFNAPYIAPQKTLIGSDVYIGHGAQVMTGLTVGDGAVIGAGSIVTKNVPPYAVVAGAPAVVKKMRFEDHIIERMLRLQWWQYAFWDLSEAPVEHPHAFLDFIERRIAEGIPCYRPDFVDPHQI